MERIEKEFSVVFSAEQSPYFQVEEKRRLSFSFEEAKGKASFQQTFIRLLFGDESRIDVIFLIFSERIYSCTCGFDIDRDWNAAINIKNEGKLMVGLA